MAKLVLITGASSGFGAACAGKFAAEGCSLILAARRLDKLKDVQSRLPQGTEAQTIQLDVTDPDSVQTFVDSLGEQAAEIDVLINSAGLALGLDPAYEADLVDWETMVNTNIVGLMRMTRAILPGMVARDRGHIINLGSVAGAWPYPGGNAYGGTKAFVKNFTQALRADLP